MILAPIGSASGVQPLPRRVGRLGRRQTLGHSLLNRLIEFWPLSEQSGDRRGVHGGLTLTDTNTVTGAAGVGSLASQFTAANTECLSRASEAAVQAGDIDFTVAAWVYPDTLSGTRIIVSKDSSGAGQREYELGPFNDQIEFNVFSAGDTAVQAVLPAVMTTGAWQFVVGWFDEAAGRAFVERNASGTIGQSTAGNTLQAASNAAFQIGAREFPASRAPWDGRIQRVGLWKRVLTADERTFLYNGGMGRDYPFV